jgi:hypothetical protein
MAHNTLVCSLECKRETWRIRARQHHDANPLPDRIGECRDCGTEIRTPSRRGALKHRCETCEKIHTVKRDAIKGYELKSRCKRYGLTVEQYEAMLIAQNGRCACCGRSELKGRGPEGTWNIDHCRKTGRVRALLCGRCNKVVGQVEENVDIAVAIAKYIAQYCRTELTAIG